MTIEPDFQLGPVTVRSMSHEIVARLHVEVLEPRVMQVLVELARQRGEVVSRDRLVERCWSGRVVSEDAIQRCIAKLRRVGSAHSAYTIDTIRSVGYRLNEIRTLDAQHPSLAVLAFDNLSSDADLDYFSDGVSEEILHAAARAAPLKVIGRASSFRFRGPDKVVARIAALLNVSHILDGSVRRSGSRVRITVRLVDVAANETVWSDRFDRDLADTFAVQDEIARAVTAVLGVAFPHREPPVAVDPFAYDLYQRGRELGAAFGTPGAMRRAIALLEEAVTRAPLLAAAWALLAQIQVQYRAGEAPQKDIESLRLAIIESVTRARALEPQDGGALSCLAFVEAPIGAFAKQEAILERAMATANSIGVLTPFSTFCASVGRNREALSFVERAWQHDPLHAGIANWRAILLRQNGPTGESNAAVERILESGGMAGTLLGHAALWAAFDGDWAFVDRLLNGADAESRPSTDDRGLEMALATIAILRHPTERHRAQVLARARKELANTGSVPLGALCLLAHLGLVDEAFALAARCSFALHMSTESRLQLADVGLHILFSRPALRLREDRRFVQLCAQLGLVHYWISSRRWPDCVDEIAPHYDFVGECELTVNGPQATMRC
jgi:TolB-like protein